jgi:hypothetical protein
MRFKLKAQFYKLVFFLVAFLVVYLTFFKSSSSTHHNRNVRKAEADEHDDEMQHYPQKHQDNLDNPVLVNHIKESPPTPDRLENPAVRVESAEKGDVNQINEPNMEVRLVISILFLIKEFLISFRTKKGFGEKS